MLNEEYEKLVRHLEEMISDGCKIVHGGHLIDWEDTSIPDILQKIREYQKNVPQGKNRKRKDL